MVIFCSLPVPRSLALTWRIPFASMSKATSICGTRAAPVEYHQLKSADRLIVPGQWTFALQDMNIDPGLVVAVLKVSDFRVGMVVLRRISFVTRPPRLNAQRKRRHVQQHHVLDLPFEHSGLNGGPNRHHFIWVDALMRLLLDQGPRRLDARGMRVMPPTMTSSSISCRPSSRVFQTGFHGGTVRSKRSSQSCSILARVSLSWMCFGPLASAVMNGRLISYSGR